MEFLHVNPSWTCNTCNPTKRRQMYLLTLERYQRGGPDPCLCVVSYMYYGMLYSFLFSPELWYVVKNGNWNINVISAYVSAPRLTARGSEISVNWESQGTGAGKVAGYRIEYRSSRDPRWTPHR